MTHQITLEEAALHLPELIQEVHHGQEVVLLLNHQPVARLVSAMVATPSPPDFSEWKAQLRRITAGQAVGELPLEATRREAFYGDDLR